MLFTNFSQKMIGFPYYTRWKKGLKVFFRLNLYILYINKKICLELLLPKPFLIVKNLQNKPKQSSIGRCLASWLSNFFYGRFMKIQFCHFFIFQKNSFALFSRLLANHCWMNKNGKRKQFLWGMHKKNPNTLNFSILFRYFRAI